LFSELVKEVTILRCVLDIDADTHQLITVNLAGVLPLAFNPLRFRGDGAKSPTKFYQSIGNQRLRYRAAVIKPKREQNFEPPAGT
jgi:hypothetical protein